jgi:hypothetical protein
MPRMPAGGDRAARYVVGCDGARSARAQAIGRQLVGDSANQAWGVMDVLASPTSPTSATRSAVQSPPATCWSSRARAATWCASTSRWTSWAKTSASRSRGITVDKLIAAAQRILHPYTLDVKEVPWWSVYEIGQRICDKYDDVPAETEDSEMPRVFIAGDACHTHSPKAGQGMNFSMQDTFNLGWKLAAVLRGQCAPELLHTYSAERQVVAQELIDFDREWAKMFSDRAEGPAEAGARAWTRRSSRSTSSARRFTAGMARTTALADLRRGDAPASGDRLREVGTRFHSAPVVRISDAKPWSSWAMRARPTAAGVCTPSPARTTRPSRPRVRALCRFLETSPIRRCASTRRRPGHRRGVRPARDLPAGASRAGIGAMPALLLPARAAMACAITRRCSAPT